MADRSTVSIKPDQRDLRGLYKALNAMDDDSKKGLKDDVTAISGWTGNAVRVAGYTSARMPAQAALVANTVRANKDRIPNITIGGSKGRASGGANAGVLLFGNEFGADRNAKGSSGLFPNGGFKFPDRSPSEGRGSRGHWIFPTLKALQPEVTRRWFEAVDKVFSNWNKGGI
jgi:hypothetical protein